VSQPEKLLTPPKEDYSQALVKLPARDLIVLLQHAIEAVPAQVFLMATTDKILLKNHAATTALAAKEDVLRQELKRASMRGSAGQVSVRRMALSGGIALAWVIRAEPRFDFRSCSMRAGRRWGLTARQRAVLEHLLEGQSNKQIATGLKCAENTVEVHVSAVLRKSGARTRSQVVSRALALVLQ
jgi:DNA-binding NarL/FixJ family response regulator